MVFAVLRRATRRQGLATADKNHLHHRLLRLGHSQRRSVLIMWAFTALLSAFALVPVITGRGTGIFVIAVVGAALLLFTMLGPWVDRKRSNRKADAPAVELPATPLDETQPDHTEQAGSTVR
jgi:UDP-GlcNAc:undecaprenyl-phosphate GlcNAc-1-phosphate transferase